jgi:hypothetical protein
MFVDLGIGTREAAPPVYEKDTMKDTMMVAPWS